MDALGLVEIEDIRPPDEGNAGRPAVRTQHYISSDVPLFEDLVIDDGSGFLVFLNITAKVDGLPEGDPEWGVVIRRAEKQGINSAIGFARNDVLDGKPRLCHGTLPRFNCSMNRAVIAW